MDIRPIPRALALVPLALLLCRPSARSEDRFEWPNATPEEVGLDRSALEAARRYALTGDGSGVVVRGGKLVLSWGDAAKTYDLKSTTKSIGVTTLGLALLDGKVRLSDPATKHQPALGVPPESNGETGWLDRITLFHLATQTAGFAKPGGYEPLLFEPGTRWHYSDGGPNWLAECLTLIYRRDLSELLFERVFTPLGIRTADLRWRRNAYRPAEIDGIPRREFGAGIHANVDAMARIGELYLREGLWQGRRILPAGFVARARMPEPPVVDLPELGDTHDDASRHYGLLWWNNADGTLARVPRDTYWSWGLYDSLIVVFPSLDMVVARAGRSWERADRDGPEWRGHYAALAPFFEPLVAAAGGAPGVLPDPLADDSADGSAPCPPSPIIAAVRWSPPESIVRRARGSDNWPSTWGDDDALYTAYGDGRGFEPFVDEKLSMGFARVTGSPPDFTGTNIRSETGEQRGDGRSGQKASGLLMIDGRLYLWARNADNARLGWSDDRGVVWKWSDWRLEESFGCPTFLNFGKNYRGARDGFVYVFSHDASSAYEPGDGTVLARVARDRINERDAYEFFSGLDDDDAPRWSPDAGRRAHVFKNRGRAYRTTASYCEPLRRYLLVQILPGDDPRFEGGFGIYDAPGPWGPWTTAYYTEKWDVAPGESASIPTKWIAEDGRSFHLVFSGEDAFSVRRGEFVRRE